MRLDCIDDILAFCYTEPNCGCWIWAGEWSISGYALTDDGRAAYRVSYEIENGPIAPGMHVDHLCRVKCCVNPAHLEQVTRSENFRRRRLFGASFKAIDITQPPRVKGRKPPAEKDYDTEFCQSLRKIGYAQHEFADLCGVKSKVTLDNWLSGRVTPPAHIQVIVELLLARPEAKEVIDRIHSDRLSIHRARSSTR